jgi:hypothetical protein
LNEFSKKPFIIFYFILTLMAHLVRGLGILLEK